jgi:DNA-binding response OmpR family regulator
MSGGSPVIGAVKAAPSGAAFAVSRAGLPSDAPSASIREMQRVLVVDDEDIVREVVCRYLERDGFETVEAADGETALQRIAEREPSLVVLDVMLPGVDGLEVCRRVRAHSRVPIILLTARGEETDRIVGLELGADDYVTKPFSPRELAVRVRAVLRRVAPDGPSDRIELGDLVIDPATRDVILDGRQLRLTAKEFDLLHFLAQNPRQVFSREHLMDRVWGYQAAFDTGTVTVHIRRLREKIENDPSAPTRIETVWGVGYRFVP